MRTPAPIAALLLALAVALPGLAPPPASAAVFEPREFADAAAGERYRRLVEELRCLVCQNQNLADSDADLAADLRNEVYRLVSSGRTEAEVVAFLVERYGDFVRYRPPLNAATLFLWAGPFALGAVAVALLLVAVRRRAKGGDSGEDLDRAAAERAEVLLRGDD